MKRSNLIKTGLVLTMGVASLSFGQVLHTGANSITKTTGSSQVGAEKSTYSAGSAAHLNSTGKTKMIGTGNSVSTIVWITP